jgi:hypothetical protein
VTLDAQLEVGQHHVEGTDPAFHLLEAASDKVRGGVQLVLFAQDLTQADIHLGQRAEMARVTLGSQPLRRLKHFSRNTQLALQPPRSGDLVQTHGNRPDVVGGLAQPHHLGKGFGRLIEIAGVAMSDTQREGKNAARDVTVRRQQLIGLFRLFDGVRRVARHAGHKRADTGDAPQYVACFTSRGAGVDQRGGSLQQRFDAGELAGKGMRPGQIDAQLRPCLHQCCRQRGNAIQQDGQLTARQQVGGVSLDQPRRPLMVVSGQCVVDRRAPSRRSTLLPYGAARQRQLCAWRQAAPSRWLFRWPYWPNWTRNCATSSAGCPIRQGSLPRQRA